MEAAIFFYEKVQLTFGGRPATNDGSMSTSLQNKISNLPTYPLYYINDYHAHFATEATYSPPKTNEEIEKDIYENENNVFGCIIKLISKDTPNRFKTTRTYNNEKIIFTFKFAEFLKQFLHTAFTAG